MKKIIMLCLISLCCYANQEEYFLQGNKFYNEGVFDKALESYQKIDYKGSAVWYNMGNCFYRLGSYSLAIAHWRLADLSAPWRMHKNIDTQCALAYQKLGKEHKDSTGQFALLWTQRAINTVSLLWWQVLFLAVWIFTIILGSRTFMQRKYWRTAGVIFLMCGILTCFMIRYKNGAGLYALVVTNEAMVRTGPADDYGIVTAVHCLDEFDIDEHNDHWLKVHNKCAAGWISDHAVVIIDAKNGLSHDQKI